MSLLQASAILKLLAILVIVHSSNGELLRNSREIKRITIANKDFNVTRIVPIAKDYAQCYVSVMVYNSTTLTQPTQGARVTVVSRSGTNYTGFSEAVTDASGQACILVHCYVEGIIFVEKAGERLFAATVPRQRLNLPPAFRVELQSRNEEVVFHSFVFGTVLGRTGPVYNSRDFGDCKTEARNNYYFSFSYLSVPDQLVSTPVPKDMPEIDTAFLTNPSSKLIWLYGLPGSVTTCYMKIKIKVGSAPVIINLESRIGDKDGESLGVFVTGPKPDPTNPTDDKLACLMFRCPVEDITGSTDYPTYITGNVTGVTACSINSQANTAITVDKLRFSGTIPVTGQLSPKDGLFQNADPNKARARCFTGNDFLGENSAFEIENNIAFEYDCTA